MAQEEQRRNVGEKGERLEKGELGREGREVGQGEMGKTGASGQGMAGQGMGGQPQRGMGSMRCSDCGISFHSQADLDQHNRSAHSSGKA